MPRYEVELVRAARAVAKHQRDIRRLRRQLKEAQKNLRLERKHLKALARLSEPPAPDVAPSRLFSNAVGHALPARETVVVQRTMPVSPIEAVVTLLEERLLDDVLATLPAKAVR